MKIIILKGGLGNQLFQISLYLYLVSFLSKEKIKIDHKTGFILDYKYKRKYELQEINELKKVTFFYNFVNATICIFRKIFPNLKSIFSFRIIDDNYRKKNIRSKKEDILMIRDNVLYDGYFQDFKIVDTILPELHKIIEPYFNKNSNSKFCDLYKQIKSSLNPVSIGIRFYEEAKDPSSHSLDGKIKTVAEFNEIIKKIENEIINPSFFIFVQEENDFTKQLNFNSPHTFVSHEAGYIGTWQRLKAQAICKHHIFNNSTYYWWGCMLSRVYNEEFEESQSKIYITDNFIFKEIYNPKWNLF